MGYGMIAVKSCLKVVCFASFLGASSLALADAAAGKEKSALCAGCHGADGISLVDEIPNLAGQKEAYLAKVLGDYRSGTRRNPIMSSIAQGLSDEDIRDLAAYFSSL